MDGEITEVLVEFDERRCRRRMKARGSDMGLFGGLLGWQADDERLPNLACMLAAAGVQVH